MLIFVYKFPKIDRKYAIIHLYVKAYGFGKYVTHAK